MSKKRIGIQALILGGLLQEQRAIKDTAISEMPEEEKTLLLARHRLAFEEKLARQGIKAWRYGEHVIMARDKKNADRKARNKKLIK